MSPEEENQYFRRLLSLHPTMPLNEQSHELHRGADKVMRGPPVFDRRPGAINHTDRPKPIYAPEKPADRWEYARTLDYSLGNLDVCGAEGWEAYAAAFNSDGKQVIWMKRRLG